MDTIGLVLSAVVHSAHVQDRSGAELVLEKAASQTSCHRLKKVWADGGYSGEKLAKLASKLGIELEVVKRSDEAKHKFVVLPRRWVVERTHSWLTNYRRLAREYERRCETAESFIYMAMSHLLLRRLAKL